MITKQHLRKVWKDEARVSDEYLLVISEELSSKLVECKLDSELRISHFIAQLVKEVGPYITLEENFNYSVQGLKNTFKTYRKNPELAEKHGRNAAINQKANQQAIANNAYAMRIGNGSESTGDGWKYRGRGMIQLTGKGNYAAVEGVHANIWDEDVSFVSSPNLVAKPKYAVRTAMIFWLNNKLYLKADKGASRTVTDSITAVVNKNTDSYGRRHEIFERLYKKGTFKDIFR
ncbi:MULTISPECIES: hypothetical protein [Vibrio]|uniref:glycoside hydrolase family 19 protein n=1 Tax=Vibrio TaxID=662 RepID=UPI002075BB36|nr:MULTISPECIES: hypothetical protein [Vibrio]USD57659.1 hypothetical protein J4N44_18095 [Vibrio sp. SCSIO 43155]CAK6712192.1 Putative chitinase [Vibrio harveyi]